jgi:hypothetical protein
LDVLEPFVGTGAVERSKGGRETERPAAPPTPPVPPIPDDVAGPNPDDLPPSRS